MRSRTLLIIAMLVGLSIACTLTGKVPSNPEAIDPGLLPTIVAGTLTASVEQAQQTADADPFARAATATAAAAAGTADAQAQAAAATLTAVASAPLGGVEAVEPWTPQPETQPQPAPSTQVAPTAQPETSPLPYTAPPTAFDTGLLRIAYYDGAGLQLWTEGGARKLLYSGEPVSSIAISDDGWVIAFTTRNEYYIETGLWRVYADGSGLQRLIDPAGLKALSQDPNADSVSPYQMEFAPGSHSLAFTTRLVFMGPGLVLQDDLRLLEMDSGQLSTLFAPGLGGMFSYSPDGGKIALVTATGIGLANSDGTNRLANLLSFPRVITYSEYLFYPAVRWAPDGSRFLAVIPAEDPLAANPISTLWQINAGNGSVEQGRTFPAGLWLLFAENTISPDLTKIAYLQQIGTPENNTWELHVARLDGSQDVLLRTGNMRILSWSPDSTRLSLEDQSELLIGDVASGTFVPLADVLPAVDSTWVDAARYLYWSGDTPNLSLRLDSLDAMSLSVGGSSEHSSPYAFTLGLE